MCNFTAPVGSGAALLTHDEVTTLFHEFGHGLHHMLTRVAYPSIAGINGVAWDAVELPSQFMENFAWRPEVLPLISAHVTTGESLPVDMLRRLLGTRTFNAALDTLRQIELASFDFELHANFDAAQGARVAETLAGVRQRVAVVPAAPFNRMPASFAHIFAGGYAAGYYSYKWAEVLAADAFEAFEEAGVFDGVTATRFLDSILAAAAAWTRWTLSFGFAAASPTFARCSSKPESRREILGCAAAGADAAAAGSVRAATAFVSDELVLGVYAEQNGQGQRLATLHSGASVETLSVNGEYTQVRLADGTTGWVKTVYLTTAGTRDGARQAARRGARPQPRDDTGAGRGGRAQRGPAAQARALEHASGARRRNRSCGAGRLPLRARRRGRRRAGGRHGRHCSRGGQAAVDCGRCRCSPRSAAVSGSAMRPWPGASSTNSAASRCTEAVGRGI